MAAVRFGHIWHKNEQRLPNVGSMLKVLESRDISNMCWVWWCDHFWQFGMATVRVQTMLNN